MSRPKIAAVYKTFQGHELAVASMQSVERHVDAICCLHSTVGWGGKVGPNTCEKVMREYSGPCPVYHKTGEWTDQIAQHDAMREFALECCPDADWFMLNDTDEVWDYPILMSAVRMLENAPEWAESAKCQLEAYLKSPFYRVVPRPPQEPVVFIRRSVERWGLRGLGTKRWLMPGIYHHHFCSVRESLTDVLSKHLDSCTVESEPIVPFDKWVAEKWNMLPHSTDLLVLARAPQMWAKVIKIEMGDLPRVLHDHPMVKAFAAYRFWGDMNKPAPRAEKQKPVPSVTSPRPLPAEFGPGHPDWNVPSKRNRWLLEQQKKGMV